MHVLCRKAKMLVTAYLGSLEANKTAGKLGCLQVDFVCDVLFMKPFKFVRVDFRKRNYNSPNC